MTTLITPRPQGLADLIDAAVHRVCLTILGDAGQVDLMTEDVVDCYDHFFLIDGQS